MDYIVVNVFINPGFTGSLDLVKNQIGQLVSASIGHLTGQKPRQEPVVNLTVRTVPDLHCGAHIEIKTTLVMFGDNSRLTLAHDVQRNQALRELLASVLGADKRLLVGVERTSAVWAG